MEPEMRLSGVQPSCVERPTNLNHRAGSGAAIHIATRCSILHILQSSRTDLDQNSSAQRRTHTTLLRVKVVIYGYFSLCIRAIFCQKKDTCDNFSAKYGHMSLGVIEKLFVIRVHVQLGSTRFIMHRSKTRQKPLQL